MINDVEALTSLGRCRPCGKPVRRVLMHKKGEPATMQRDPHYDDVLREVKAFLKESVERAKGRHRRRPHRRRPRLRFGKTALHNLAS